MWCYAVPLLRDGFRHFASGSVASMFLYFLFIAPTHLQLLKNHVFSKADMYWNEVAGRVNFLA
jgi:hypothetical protein